jgi:hypothetical protein
MPHKDGKSGSYIIDRVFRHVGRIKCASGTAHAPTFRRINEMLTTLHGMGRLDVLRSIRRRELSPLVVWEAYRVGALDKLPSGATMRNLEAAMTKWREDLDASPSHKASVKSSIKHLVAASGGAHATVSELPNGVLALRTTLAKKPTAFNRARAAALSFARDTLTKVSPVYTAIGAVAVRPVRNKRTRPRPTPWEVEQFTKRMAKDHRDMTWTLLTTGMGKKEYWEDGFTVLAGDAIRIDGKKRAGRKRRVPRILTPVKPACWYGAYRAALAKATKDAVQPYDLRGTYAHWMESAGIPRTRRRIYLGHGAQDITDLYEEHEIREFLAADAKKLRSWLEVARVTEPENAEPATPHLTLA